VPRALIAETINVVVVLVGRGSERRVAELAAVRELAPNGDYVLDSTTPETSSAGDPS
jgi:type IV secretion system protein VirB11